MLWLSTGGDDVITVEGESCVAEESVSGGKEEHPRSSLVGEDHRQQWRRPGGSSGDSKSRFPIFQGSGPRGSAFVLCFLGN